MAFVASLKGWFTTVEQPKTYLDEYAQTRENKYLSRFVEQHHHALYHYLLTQSDEALAQDVIQTTWLKVIRQIGYYKIGFFVSRAIR